MVGVAQAPPRAVASGARSGALLAIASAISIVVNYIFLLAAGRVLGSEAYGSLAALLGVLAMVLIPAGALQMAVSREISRRMASGDTAGADAFTRTAFLKALRWTPPVLAVALALAWPLAHLLHIHSVGVVVLTETAFATALVSPVAMGVLQGRQRFHALASLYVAPFIVRLAVFALAAAVGYRLGGAVAATVASAVAGAALAAVLIRDALLRTDTQGDTDIRPFLRYLGQVAVGLVGIALLTHIDLLIVKARFSGDEPGAYAAASAFARVGFFLPATILAVLFPRAAARQARGEETEDILGRSLLATVAFCSLLALFYAATGIGLISTTFGPDFAAGGEVLAPFALAIGLFSLANIFVGYHLSRGETRYAWIVAGGVLVQVTVLALVPSSLRGIVWANVAIGVALIAAHELFVGSSATAVRAGLRRVGATAGALRAIVPEAGLVLVGTTAFVCALFWPVVAHFGSTIIGSPGSDSTGGVGFLWQLQHEGGYHILGVTHHTLTGAPFGWDSTNAVNVQYLLPYYPTYLAAQMIGEVAALNLVALAGYVLSGATMYLLVRYLGCGKLAAAWAALVFIVFPYHLAHEEHASLLHLEVLALLLIALVAVARRPTWTRFALVALANLACWLTSGYFGAMAAVVTVAFTVGAALVSNRGHALRLVGGVALCGLAATALLGLVAVASDTNSGAGLDRAVGDLSIFGLRPVELFVPPNGDLVLGDRLDNFWATRFHGSNQTEITTYLGLLTWALAATWLVVAFLRRRALSETARVATAGLVCAFVVGLLFAAPSPILLFGHEVWTPSRLMWEAVPAFRVPSRWDFFLMTALVPLAALGLQALTRALTRPGGSRAIAPALVGVAMIVSFLELAIHPARPRFRTVPVPPEYAAIDRTPTGVVADYPLGYSDIFRLWQRRHGRPLLNGGPADSTSDYARLVVLDPTQTGTAQTLSFLGVTAIGIHPGAHVDAEVDAREPTGTPGYKLVGRFPDGASVWQVTARPAPALVTLPGGFAKPKRGSDAVIGYAFVSSAGVGVFELTAKTAGVIRLVFEAVPPTGARRSLRLADSKGEQAFTLNGKTVVSVLVEVPRGRSQLLVKTDPPPTSEADAIVLSTPRAEAAVGTAVLHADLVSADPGF